MRAWWATVRSAQHAAGTTHPTRLDVTLGEPLHFGEFVSQVACEAGNDACAPAFLPLTLVDELADVPVEANQFSVHGQDGTGLGSLDTILDVVEQDSVVPVLGKARRRDGPSRS